MSRTRKAKPTPATDLDILLPRLARAMGWHDAHLSAPVPVGKKTLYRVMHRVSLDTLAEPWTSAAHTLAELVLVVAGAIKSAEEVRERFAAGPDAAMLAATNTDDLVAEIARRAHGTRNKYGVVADLAHALMSGTRDTREPIANALVDAAFEHASAKTQRQAAEDAGLAIAKQDERLVSVDDADTLDAARRVLLMVHDGRPADWWLPELARVARDCKPSAGDQNYM